MLKIASATNTKFSYVGNRRCGSVLKTPVLFRNSFRYHMLCTSPPVSHSMPGGDGSDSAELRTGLQ